MIKSEYKKVLQPVSVAAASKIYTPLYWNGTEYAPAMGAVTDTHAGDNSEVEFSSTKTNIAYGSVSVLVDDVAIVEGAGAGKFVMNYSTGKVTFGTAPENLAEIKVTYKHFNGEPDALAAEAIAQSQDPAAAMIMLEGVVYADELPSDTLINEDAIARLARRNIFIEERPVQVF
jgi:hypothetical protein